MQESPPTGVPEVPQFNTYPNVPLAISEPEDPVESVQDNDGWEPIVPDSEPAAEGWEPPEHKYSPQAVGLTPTAS